jgi:hypothetical protein
VAVVVAVVVVVVVECARRRSATDRSAQREQAGDLVAAVERDHAAFGCFPL